MHKNEPVNSKLQSFLNSEDDSSDTFKLHQLLSIKQILGMKEWFDMHPERCISRTLFRSALMNVAHIIVSDEDFECLCAKINFTRNLNVIYWREFLMYLRAGLDNEYQDHLASKLELPITEPLREYKSHHRLPISKMLFVPEIQQQDRTINYLYGVYVTCSRDGLINYWSVDMEKERTVYSKSPKLISQQTWITDIVSLADVNVICTSSTERDLRFYDTTAKKFELRVMISSLEDMVCTMHYNFSKDVNVDSTLLIGNSLGMVKLIYIKSKDRGPFKSSPKQPLTSITYDQFVKGAIRGMRLIDIPTSHTDWVRQVAYYETIHCVVSISTCSKESMLIYSPKTKESSYSFKVPKGFSCFAIADGSYTVATGGPDCLIRIWNPFMPSRAISVMRGHHANIISLTFQDSNKILISIDKDKCVKVWDVAEQICIQNYFGLPSGLGERTPLCTYYNPISRQVFVASKKIVFFRVYPLLNGEYTDGISHSKEISVILYNPLFKHIVTCGFDSFIIFWNPWKGKREEFVRNAHTVRQEGVEVPIEITAATFDPSNQFLITGASNGTLKVWNFIIKACIRHMEIERSCEIYAIVWITNRILVMGENKLVTEFADSDDIGSSRYKHWMGRHLEDILCAATYLPQTLVTASQNGEIVFWRLETGQSYGKFNVSDPRVRIKLQYQLQIPSEKTSSSNKPPPKKSSYRDRRTNASSAAKPLISSESALGLLPNKKYHNINNSEMDVSGLGLAVNALVSFTNRPSHPLVGTVAAAIENGYIQIWSHHPGGGYITNFKAIHNNKDYVISLCTDPENKYLFTGHMFGYIKTWLMLNYAMPEEMHEHICMPMLRLQFPFLWRDIIPGRAKRGHKKKVPVLLNSYRAHLKPVTGMIFIGVLDILSSVSSDGSARIWTYNGRYMGTLGTFKHWTNISSTEKSSEDKEYALPADIHRSGSFTTLKVLNGGKVERFLTRKQQQQQYEQMSIDNRRIYGCRIDLNQVLGKHFKIPFTGHRQFGIILDNSLPDVPIYGEISLQEPEIVTKPQTPPLMKNIRMQRRLTLRPLRY